MDSHLIVTPAIFKPGSMVFKNQKKKQKRGFPIKDFGNDGGGEFPPAFREWRKGVTVRHLHSLLITHYASLITDYSSLSYQSFQELGKSLKFFIYPRKNKI